MEKMIEGNTSTIMLVLFLHLMISLSFFEVSAVPVGYTREELSVVAGYGEERLSSVLVSGTVKCEHFNEREELVSTGYVGGAKVAVACKEEWRKKTIWVRGTTDEYGEFMLDLPSKLHGIPRLEEACVVKLLQLPKKSSCHSNHHHLKRKTSMKLSSVGNSIRVYTTGTIRLQNYVQKELNKNDKERVQI